MIRKPLKLKIHLSAFTKYIKRRQNMYLALLKFLVCDRRSRSDVHTRRVSARRQEISSLSRTFSLSGLHLFVSARTSARHPGTASNYE